MRLMILILLPCAVKATLWLPFANLGTMFETIREAAMRENFEDPNGSYSATVNYLAQAGIDLFENLQKLLHSTFDDEGTRQIAKGLLDMFNITTAAPIPAVTNRIMPKLIPVTDTIPTKKFTFPYGTRYQQLTTAMPASSSSSPHFSSSSAPIWFLTTQPPTESVIAPTTSTLPPVPIRKWRPTTEKPLPPPPTRPPTTTTTRKMIEVTTPYVVPVSTFRPLHHKFTTRRMELSTTTPTTTTSTASESTTSVYKIWPTTPLRPRPITWRPVFPDMSLTSTTAVPTTTTTTTQIPTTTTTRDNIPLIIKTRRLTRPPVGNLFSTTTMAPVTQSSIGGSCEVCKPGERCQLKLRSFETSDPTFQYCYSHSTIIDLAMQGLLKETQTSSFPSPLSWHSVSPPEVIQLAQTIMSLYQPSRCLVIGVFTGLSLLGVASHVDSRGIVLALEHPQYAQFWEHVGLKHAKKMPLSQISRIQVRSTEPIERALSALAANEPNSFDFIFLDDFKRDNYLDDYEHSVRLLRPGGLLIINQALNGGGVLSGNENMSPEDKVIRNMNVRIKQDARIRASFLPYGGGTWLIAKK